ncbi:hypothetical protein [Streptomyces caelestis]|uniref:Uncharacterized protein n=1 Tax=Streptomyces caelestis TaxID=36816 RepID=A0A7W9GYI8_9ACTN|nr:hypothetical protein [Streptomyces caelestis]GGW79440.1 hypothetical protein GCM10010320_71790 [Streptomyces caelestis]
MVLPRRRAPACPKCSPPATSSAAYRQAINAAGTGAAAALDAELHLAARNAAQADQEPAAVPA